MEKDGKPRGGERLGKPATVKYGGWARQICPKIVARSDGFIVGDLGCVCEVRVSLEAGDVG